VRLSVFGVATICSAAVYADPLSQLRLHRGFNPLFCNLAHLFSQPRSAVQSSEFEIF
jgi:hypothetical protein